MQARVQQQGTVHADSGADLIELEDSSKCMWCICVYSNGAKYRFESKGTYSREVRRGTHTARGSHRRAPFP